MRSQHFKGGLRLFVLVAALGMGSCLRDGSPEPAERQAVPPEVSAGKLVRVGDIDSDTPARRISRIQPLARYLGSELAALGFAGGRVVIARDIEEMAALMSSGEVDVYLDSAFPTLAVQMRTGSRILLRRWAQGAPEYKTVFVARVESGIDSFEQLRGASLALQEEYSTSGFLLPAGTLLERGLPLRRAGGPGEIEPGVISYFFTRDEENTVELVTTGKVAAGAISNQEYDLLDPVLRDGLRIIGETVTMPRQLVSVRPDLPSEVSDRVSVVLLALAPARVDPVRLDEDPAAWTWKFEPVTPETVQSLERLRAFGDLLGVM